MNNIYFNKSNSFLIDMLSDKLQYICSQLYIHN